MSKSSQEIQTNVEKTTPVATPVVENPSAVAQGFGGTSKKHLMRDLTRQEIQALSKEDKIEYVKLNKPRWREKAHTEVSGVFKNLENRGGSVSFNFAVYPGDDFRTWEFKDGQHYRIPYSVAVHLNDDCYYKEYQELKGDFGQDRVMNALHDGRAKAANMQMATKVYRYAFHSLEYSRDELSISRSNLAEVYVSP